MLPSQLESHTLKTLPWQFSISLRGRKLVGGPLKHHEWTIYDLQYVFLFVLGLFLFYIIEFPGFALKLVIVALFAIGLCHPVSRIFVLPFLPVACWLILFYACRFVPGESRPHIYVSLLPTLENILYGDNLSAIIATHTNVIKDVLAWFPYGVVHFTIPFVTSAGLWWFGPPGILRVFASAFGYMNIAGVLTQLAFPCSPPWYEYTYGLNTPANYDMHGHPGGLARIDELFNTNTYTTTFGKSPMVFGAFPSLHSGCAIVQALFISYVAPKLRAICFAYIMWIWWACMYLTHHYMVDLVGGGVYAGLAFWCAWKWLPPVQKGLSTRWDYLKEGLLPTHGDSIRDSTALYIRVPTAHARRDSSLDGDLDDSVIIVAEDTYNKMTIFDIDDEMDLGDGFSKISKFDR